MVMVTQCSRMDEAGDRGGVVCWFGEVGVRHGAIGWSDEAGVRGGAEGWFDEAGVRSDHCMFLLVSQTLTLF